MNIFTAEDGRTREQEYIYCRGRESRRTNMNIFTVKDREQENRNIFNVEDGRTEIYIL